MRILLFLKLENFCHFNSEIVVLISSDGFVMLKAQGVERQQMTDVVLAGLAFKIDLNLCF